MEMIQLLILDVLNAVISLLSPVSIISKNSPTISLVSVITLMQKQN